MLFTEIGFWTFWALLCLIALWDEVTGYIPNHLSGFLLMAGLAGLPLHFDGFCAMTILLSLLLFFSFKYRGQTTLGWGDVKLMLALSLFLSWILLPYFWLFSSLGALLDWWCFKRRYTPFAPWIALSFLLTFFFQENLKDLWMD